MEYLINIALTFVPSAVTIVFLYFVASMAMKRMDTFKDTPVFKDNRFYLWIFLAASLALSAMSPSITYKHQTFDAVQDSNQIELIKQQEQERTDLVIEDRTRKDHSVTNEEWDNKSSYTKGVE
jgi:cell division protein FtsL